MRLLIDLDNTLVDRAGAFRRWAEQYVVEARLSARAGASTEWQTDSANIAWLLAADRDGYTPRDELAAAMAIRFGLSEGVDRLVDRLLFEHVQYVRPYDGVRERLARLNAVVVTNGTIAQQEAKLREAGLHRYLPTAVISERLGVKKPDQAMFLAGLGGAEPDDAWMVGDHPEADIAGARALGIRTAWVSHGRPWMNGWQPTIVATTTAEALDAIAALED